MPCPTSSCSTAWARLSVSRATCRPDILPETQRAMTARLFDSHRIPSPTVSGARCAYGSSRNQPCGGAGVLQVATADSRSSVVTPGSDEPTAQAHAVMERVLALVRECRLVLRKLEHPATLGESPSAEAGGWSL